MPDGLERVREPRAVVIALGRDEDLRLVLEAPERLAVGDAVAVALERAAQPAGHLGDEPAASLRRAHRERREPARLLGIEARQEGSRRQVQWSACARAILLEPTVAPGTTLAPISGLLGGLHSATRLV